MTSILPDWRSMPIKYSMFFFRSPRLLGKVVSACSFLALESSKVSLPSSPYLPSFASNITLGSITSTVCHAPFGIWQPYLAWAVQRWMRCTSRYSTLRAMSCASMLCWKSSEEVLSYETTSS